MAHCNPDFETKGELKEAVKAGRRVVAYNPGELFPVSTPTEYIEGPSHYHNWYAKVETRKADDGTVVIVKVVS